jgi:TonB family protein
MRLPAVLCLAALLVTYASAQTASNSLPPLPRDPQAMLETAASLYDFDSPDLKPFHLKGSYQLYGPKEILAGRGTYEYWWTAPGVYRSSWTRPGAARTDWHTASGRNMSQASGDRLSFIEQQLQLLLFAPFPDVRKLDPRDFDLKKDQLGSGKTALPCVDIKTHRRKDGTWPVLPGAAAHFFCFEPGEPLLRLARDAEVLNFEFNSLKKFQNRILAGSITIAYGNQKLLAFTVDTIGPIAGDEAAVTPPADAKPSAPLGLSGPSASQARLTKKAVPIYPEEAKAERISGTVVLDVMVGSDGKVRDLRVVGSPSPSLTKSSLECISNWQYTPYLADGQPLEVNTLVTVIYALSR